MPLAVGMGSLPAAVKQEVIDRPELAAYPLKPWENCYEAVEVTEYSTPILAVGIRSCQRPYHWLWTSFTG
jgi:hypothetical protein